MAKEGFFLPMVEEGFSFRLSPWPNVDIDMGLLVFYPPQMYYSIYQQQPCYKEILGV